MSKRGIDFSKNDLKRCEEVYPGDWLWRVNSAASLWHDCFELDCIFFLKSIGEVAQIDTLSFVLVHISFPVAVRKEVVRVRATSQGLGPAVHFDIFILFCQFTIHSEWKKIIKLKKKSTIKFSEFSRTMSVGIFERQNNVISSCYI